MPCSYQEPLVYRLDLSIGNHRLERAFSLLSVDERHRAERYQVETPRRQFIGCRAALRILLSKHLDCCPSEIQLTTGRFGKPLLKGTAQPNQARPVKSSGRLMSGAIEGQPLYFSVSHSANIGLIALSRSPIGVDLEEISPRIQARSLVALILSPQEMTLWRQLSPRVHQQQIIRLWVCKEALLKAVGLGIADCLQQVSFPLPLPEDQSFAPSGIDASMQIHMEEEGTCASNPWLISNLWRIHPLHVSPNHVSATAVFGAAGAVVYKEFDWTTFDQSDFR
jgi:4'-phosphopantetheinyl transferase